MYPVLFTFPGSDFQVTTFGLMVVLGFLGGTHMITKIALRYFEDAERMRPAVEAVPMWLLIGVIAGARLLYVIVEVGQGSLVGQAFVHDPLTIFFVHRGGLVMYGGTFGAILGGWLATRRHGLPFLQMLDVGLVGGFLGLAIGRVGCLLVGDDFGSVVPEHLAHLPFPITIHVPEQLRDGSLFGESNAGQVLWATQPWMTLNGLMLYFVGLGLLKRRRYLGQVSLQLLLLYAVGRFVIEMFRGDSIRGLWFGGAISTSQLISLVLFAGCLVLLFVCRGRSDPEAQPPPPAEST